MSKQDLRKAPMCEKEQTKHLRMTSINYGAFHNSVALHNYNNIFSKNKVFIERFVKQTTLRDFTIGTVILNDVWIQIIVIKGTVQQEAVRIFYSNIHNINFTNLSFEIEVYGVRILINPDQVAMILEIARPTTDIVAFPNQGIDKAHISMFFKREGSS